MGVDPKNVEIKNEINTISRLKNAGATEKNIDKEDFDISLSTFTMELFQKYEHKLKRYNSLDFDDLIVKTNLLFEENPDLRENILTDLSMYLSMNTKTLTIHNTS